MAFGFGKKTKTSDDPSCAEAERLLREVDNFHKGDNRYYYGYNLKDIPPAVAVLESSTDVQRAVITKLVAKISAVVTRGSSSIHYTHTELLSRLLRRKLPLTADDLLVIVRFIQTRYLGDLSYVVGACERFSAQTEIPTELREALVELREVARANSHDKQARKQTERLSALLGEEVVQRVYCDSSDVMGDRMLADMQQIQDTYRDAMVELLIHASDARGGKPTKGWLKKAEALVGALDQALLCAAITVWSEAFDQPRPEPAYDNFPESVWVVSDMNADLLKGLLWLTPQFADDGLVRAIGRVGISGQKKLPGVGPRCHKVTNAAVWALGQIDRPLAIGQLAILKSRVKNKAAQKQIEKAMHAAADRMGVSPSEVEEMAVPTYGLTGVGVRREPMGEFTAELVILGTGTTELRWIKPDGKTQKTVPKAVKDGFADELKEIKAAAKDIQKMLPAQRDRIDQLHLQQKRWPYGVWVERYLDHALVGSLARRMIWTFGSGDGSDSVSATWLDGSLVDASGVCVSVKQDAATVSIWHPIGRDQAEVLAWRAFFESREIKQPIKQAHREVYLLTDAERNTGVYSNRYAAHLIKQHQFNALCGVRGWQNQLRLMVDDEYPPASLALPQWDLRAEFWVEGAGDDYAHDANEAGTYLYLATDQVRFYPLGAAQVSAHAGGGGYAWSRWRGEAEPEPIPVDQVPALVFSEVMRDIDLFVGVASVGNDPAWEDGGRQQRYGHEGYWANYSFGDLSGTAKTRKDLLERLIPRLKIAEQCSLDDRFLVVKGSVRTYKIHLGSGNILMEPNDQYLCIVPGGGAVKGPAGKVFLPFEGDRTLSIILSKAFLLADDQSITDSTILSQIRSRT